MGVGILSCCKNRQEDNNSKINEGPLVVRENGDLSESLIPVNASPAEMANEAAEMSKGASPILAANFEDVNANIIDKSVQEDYKSIKKLFFYFEKFELTYKYYDDFGLTFDPILNFKANAHFERTYEQKQKEIAETEEPKNDMSNNDSFTGDRSFVLNPYLKTSSGMGNTNNNLQTSNKEFYFNAFEAFDVQDMDQWPYNKVKFTLYNRSKTQQYNFIQVGFTQVPLMVLLDEGNLEGKFPIRNKLTKVIGFLYIRIKCIINEQELQMLNQENLEHPILDNESSFLYGINQKVNDYYSMILMMNYNDLDPVLQSNFILRKVDVLLKNIKDTEKGWNEKKSKQEQEKELDEINLSPLSAEEIGNKLFEAVFKQQQIMIYGILNYIISRIQKKDMSYINEFLDLVNKKKADKEIDLFYFYLEIFPSKNIVLIKQFSIFIYKLLELYREIELNTETATYKLDSEQLFTIMLDSMGHLNVLLTKDLEYEETEELKEIFYWGLNVLLLLITPNVTDKLINLEVINKLYSIAFNNCIKLIAKPQFLIEVFLLMSTNSEIVALLVKVFRKGIQILLDDKNNYVQHSDNPKVVAASLKALLINDGKSNTFLSFVKLCLTKNVNYPEVFSSILLILIYFCSDNKYPEIIRQILDGIEISLLCSSFDYYRGNLKKFGKNINFFFYKFISLITEIKKSFEEEEICVNFKHSEIREICNEFLKLFRMKQSAKETFEKSRAMVYFIKKKNLDLHEVLCCISANLTKNNEACKIICKDKCYFIQHIIEYFFDLTRDSIKKTLEKFRNNKKDKIALFISIIDNTLILLDNLISRSPASKDFFMNFLNMKNLTKNKVKYHITDLLDTASTILNCNNQKLKKTAENFIQNFE